MDSVKRTFFVGLIAFGLVFYFRHEIIEHFQLEEIFGVLSTLPVYNEFVVKREQKAYEQAPQPLPRVATIAAADVYIYRTPGQDIIARGSKGDVVSFIDTQDTGQLYFSIRYNGIAGYAWRKDLQFENKQKGQTNGK